MAIRPRRSVLYMPGSNARALEKARALPADALILDLEDSVALEAKELARVQVVAAVKAGGFGGREVVVRVNGLKTPWGADDLAAAVEAAPDAILIPKVESASEIRDIGARLEHLAAQAGTRLWAMIETPLGVIRSVEIAAARQTAGGERLDCFVIGTNDLAKETRSRLVQGRQPMLAWLSTVVIAARAYGLDVIDGVSNDLDDAEAFLAECRQGVELGMDGKTLIHPKQIAAANAVFSPSPDEVAWARRVLAAFALPENSGKGVIALDGRMVEWLHAEMAGRTVAISEAVEAGVAA
ncbi:MAG: CoA ester lyase [Ancalomicrobiaceae bacterium]|nr:CoA ester lyase [Ancalomicrobiaceae bacterium]